MKRVVSKEGEFWLLVGSQELYGDETLGQVLEQSSEIARKLNTSPDLPRSVVLKPVLTSQEHIRNVLLAAASDHSCLGVILWMHTFSPAKMWATGLKNFFKPILHWHTQANRELPWSQIDMDFMNLNQAAHGDREHGHIQSRLGKRRTIVVGHVSNLQTTKKIARWMRAAIAWDSTQNLRMARFGDNMRNVAVTDGDKVAAQIDLGLTIETYAVNELVAAVESAKKSEIDEVVNSYLTDYEVQHSLMPNGVQHSSLRDAAAIEIGLRTMLALGNFNAFTTNFEDLGALKQLPGIAVQRLMNEGFGFGAEGDWKTSALLYILNSLTEGIPGGSSFMEDYTYHFSDEVDLVLGAHMLEVSPRIYSGKPKCEIHALAIGGKSAPVRLVFNADSGSGRVTGLMDNGDRFRLLTNAVEIVQPAKKLEKLPVASAVWHPEPNLETAAECWIYAGGSHHTVLSNNLELEDLREFSNVSGIELLEIERDTEFYGFRNQLRINSLYYSFRKGEN
jgi:L-arabinose isomerase